MKKRAQYSVVELVLAVLLFSSSLVYFINSYDEKEYDSSKITQTALNSLYFNSSLIKNVILEDLSNSSITQNWSKEENKLNNIFGKNNYELIISNFSINKKIFNCTKRFNKYIASRPISIYNLTEFKFRIVILGVCN